MVKASPMANTNTKERLMKKETLAAMGWHGKERIDMRELSTRTGCMGSVGSIALL